MNHFEYISVLLSILIGLSMTQLLSGIARLLRDGHALARAWWVMVVVATLLLANFQVWWVSFGWRWVTDWTFFSYVTFMTLPVILYLMSYLVLPADAHLDGAELARAFIAKRRPFYVLLALVPVASFVQQWMLTHQMLPLTDLDTDLRLFWPLLAVPGYLSNRSGVQALVALASFILLATYVCLLFVRMR